MFRILIVEDNQALANGLKRYLEIYFQETAVSVVSTGKECLAMLKKDDFDIVLTDINLPDLNGIELTRFIKKAKPSTKVIAITGMIEKYSIGLMIEAGASGYILKTSIADELVEGIESVMKGNVFISKELG